MTRPKPECQDVGRWLEANLGRGVLAALTGTDAKALAAAVHLVELYAYDGGVELPRAFAIIVLRMQPSTRYLAFHAIAKVMEWDDRFRLWAAAGLEPIPANTPECANAR